jgi:hypothetical protein
MIKNTSTALSAGRNKINNTESKLMVLAGDDWWNGMSAEQQAAYLEQHKHSHKQTHGGGSSGDNHTENKLSKLNAGILTIYRGISQQSKENGSFYTQDKEFARQFTQSGSNSEIIRRQIKVSDVYKPAPPVYAGDENAVDAAIEKAKQAGCKAILLSEDKGVNTEWSIFVFDKSGLIKS